METKFENPIERKDVVEHTPLQVVLVYDDFEMAVRGKRICDLFARELGVEEQVGLSVWRFDLLLSLDLIPAAVQQAEQADVIIVASRKRNALPIQIKSWLEQFPPRRKAAFGTMVAVFDSAGGLGAASSGAELELRRVAAKAGMDFFCGALDQTGTSAVTAQAAPVRSLEKGKTVVHTTGTATTASAITEIPNRQLRSPALAN